MDKRLFTSESVTEGHPDKVCDAISDAILDALMAQDPMSRVACETATCTGFVLVTGEITSQADIDIPKIVRQTVNEIGYNDAATGFDGNTCAVMVAVDEQSSDIAMGVDKALEAKENKMSDEELEAIGAGDQGMMFGYATNETEEYMPYPISLAHKLALQLTKVRKDGTLKYLRPDGKTQVSVEYDEAGKPVRLEAVVLSTQHDPDVTQEQIHNDIKKYVFDEILPKEMIDADTKFFINPTGRFVIGGPHGDAGLTGRKIIVDTYGGYARHGGGAFSGKDCTKVDRSAAYAARYVAKNIVAAGLAEKCEIQLSYAIGVAQPTSVMVDTFGTGKISDEKLVEIIRENFDLRPAGIIKMLDLRRPIYKQTAAYGHFGRNDLNLPWEALDKADELKKYKIDLSYYSHLNSELSNEKVELINKTLDEVLEKAGKLQGEIAQQKKLIKKTIEMYSSEINEFLYYAGYKYQVAIEEENTTDYHLVLKHIEGTDNVQTVNEHLSYGERNAFALVLFMYSVLKENPDLVVLDDPISSFDGNKKFAIINMLFMGKHSLKNRTVLLLTHEFNTVIDAIYNMPYNFNPTPTAAFLTTKQGILQEKEITKADIKSFGEIAHANISSDMDSLNKLVYLRRLLEIENASGLAWQLLSNIFHKREKPEYHFSNGTPNRLMTPEEIQDATNEIKTNYISDFDYDTEYQKTQDITVLKELYQNSGSNYEKLQIYRIMFNENSSNSVIKKFVNEAFHIENDYLFQLNPCEYDTVPQYIIDECDKDILEICPQG